MMNSLEEIAHRIADIYNLPDRLNKYGEVHLVGNIALGTTVKPDIDIQIYADEENWENNASEIISELRKEGLTDFIQRSLKESGKYLVSFALVQDELRWTIDITQTLPNQDYLKDAYTFYLQFKDKLTTDKQTKIKELKRYFQKRGMLHHSMSYYIYRAVLDENITTAEGMFGYLEKNNINISKFRGKK